MTNCPWFRPDTIPVNITNLTAGRRITNVTPGKVYGLLEDLRFRGEAALIAPLGKHEAAERGVDAPSLARGSICERPACEYHHVRDMLYRPKRRAETGAPDVDVLKAYGFEVEELV